MDEAPWLGLRNLQRLSLVATLSDTYGTCSDQMKFSSNIREGARMAELGEFTKRAFPFNGRVDLTRCAADIIRAKTMRRRILRSPDGFFS